MQSAALDLCLLTMPAMASQVEVQTMQCPPGLQLGSGCRPLLPAGASPSTQVGKDDIVKEVTSAVREHIDLKTTAAMEALWHKGQKAMQFIQQQHQQQTEKLQSQLVACTDNYRKLERENVLLRANLEALMSHLTMLVSLSPPGPSPSPNWTPSPLGSGPSPFFPWNPGMAAAMASKAAGAEAAASPRDDGWVPVSLPNTPKQSDSTSSGPGLSDAAAARWTEKGAVPAEPEAGEKALTSEAAVRRDWVTITRPKAKEAQTQTFTLTLRRADTVPLGLDVVGEDGGGCLTVQSIRPGGAVEAWNRQCPGELREIQPGDRIVCINDHEDATAMREECLTKHLVKMTVVRTVSKPPPQTSFRAEALSFIPEGSTLESARGLL